MIEESDRRKIISNAINAAICIDDKYPSPYTKNDEDEDNEQAKTLYQSFREQGKCALDIYKYNNLNTFEKDKDYLLNHKELMILDWELNGEAPGKAKFEEALKVLDNAVSDKHIRCVTIYTQSENLDFIRLQIYSYFSRVYSDNEIEEKLNNFIDDIAEKIEEIVEIDDGLCFLNDFLSKKSSGFSLSSEETKNEIFKSLRGDLLQNVENKDRRDFCSFIKEKIENLNLRDNKSVLSYYEIIHQPDINNYKYQSDNTYSVDVYKREYLLINNTIVFVLNKSQTAVNDVYNEITKAIYEIPNQRTLLLSLIMKNILYENTGKGGKGLGQVTDNMLMHHWQSYECPNIDDLIEFLVLCMKEDIAEYLRNDIESSLIEELFALDENEKKVSANKEELALFNKIITFVEKVELPNLKHKIKTGDIFRLTSPLYKNNNENANLGYDDYLICISQSCSCLRPNKINNNFAFAYGSTRGVSLLTVLRHIENEDKYSIIDKNTAIEWTDKFFTIHIEENEFDVNTNITVNINNQERTLEYVGILKDLYAQRIINKVFNNALKIGVDLPHFGD